MMIILAMSFKNRINAIKSNGMSKTILITKENVEKHLQELNLQILSTLRARVTNVGWTDIKIESTFYDESVTRIAELVCGAHTHLIERVQFIIRNQPHYEWFSGRVVYNVKLSKWVYVAGQSEPEELRMIRTGLTKA